MMMICPKCRTPSELHAARCWVCEREFDGTEPAFQQLPVVTRPAWEKRDWPFFAYALPERKSA